MIEGKCLCGALRYSIDEEAASSAGLDVMHCHCARCRRHHAAPFASWIRVAVEAVQWQESSAALHGATSRAFCSKCGAVAPQRRGDEMWIPVGNLVTPFRVSRQRHMHVADQAPWHTLPEGAEMHEQLAPGWEAHDEQGSAMDAQDRDVAPGAGACLCGAVRFAVMDTPQRWLQCHCSRCRLARSAVHGSNTFYPAAQFRWMAGKELVASYKLPEAVRFQTSFCVRCGGGAPVERDNVPFVLIPAGLFLVPPAARPEAHIHVASGLHWYPIPQGLPQFAELP